MPKGPKGQKRPADVIGNAGELPAPRMPAQGTDGIGTSDHSMGAGRFE